MFFFVCSATLFYLQRSSFLFAVFLFFICSVPFFIFAAVPFFVCSASFLFAAFLFCLQRFSFVCSVSFLFAAFLFCLQRFFFVCSVSFLFAAFLFCLQRFFFVCSVSFLFAACPLWATVLISLKMDPFPYKVFTRPRHDDFSIKTWTQLPRKSLRTGFTITSQIYTFTDNDFKLWYHRHCCGPLTLVNWPSLGVINFKIAKVRAQITHFHANVCKQGLYVLDYEEGSTSLGKN